MNFELIDIFPVKRERSIQISGTSQEKQLSSYVERAARRLYSSLAQKTNCPASIDYDAVEEHVMDRLYHTLSRTAGVARAFDDSKYPDEAAAKRVTDNIPAVAMKYWERVLARVMDATQLH